MAFNFLAGQITRTWEVKAGDNVYQIQLHHHSLSGQRYLTLNGREVPGSEVWPILRDLDDILKVQQGRTTMLSNAETISFDIGEKLGSVSIASGAGRFVYTCFFDGETLVEDNEKGGRKEHEDVYDIDIPDAVEGVDEKGSRVVWYTLHTTRESDNSKTVVHRRFRDFFSLNEEVRSAYKGSQLLSSFPSLPSRTFKLFSNNFSHEFVDERRQQLVLYMRRLCKLPRMTANLDFQAFSGIVGSVKEYAILFPEGPMGITLEKKDDMVAVQRFVNTAAGEKGFAENTGLIQVGDMLSKVNGENSLGEPYTNCIYKIKTAKRPLCLHFLHQLTSGPITDEKVQSATAHVEETATGGGGGGSGDEPALETERAVRDDNIFGARAGGGAAAEKTEAEKEAEAEELRRAEAELFDDA